MYSRFLFALLALCILASAALVFFLPSEALFWTYVPLGVGLLTLVLLLRSVIKPSAVAMRGMELISEQDPNSRLVHVGERNADKIVELFNSLIDKLRGERLRNMEHDSLLHLLIEASPMGVMILDFDGKVNLINDSMLRITGINDRAAVLGRGLEDFPYELMAKMAKVPPGGSMILRCGDVRRYRCYHLNFLQTGFRRRFYLLESLTEEVMKAEREAYEKVIRIMSHEVNNTMGGVRSVLDMLGESAADSEVREVIRSCDDRCQMMCSFIRAYADVVKVPEPVKSRVELTEVLGAMLPFLREMAGNNIEVEISADGCGHVVNIDVALFQQVIVNIVKNAVESISGEGRININAAKMGNKVLLDIANDGKPITEEVSQKLFTPFFTTKKDGRGLGLTLIGEILRRHEASFSLTSADGLTHFRIVLQ